MAADWQRRAENVTAASRGAQKPADGKQDPAVGRRRVPLAERLENRKYVGRLGFHWNKNARA
jgi:hypothetical protein